MMVGERDDFRRAYPARSILFSGIFALGFTGPVQSETHATEGKHAMQSYQVGKMIDGAFSQLGTITFDENNAGTLDLDVSGEEADRLQGAWADVVAKPSLRIRRTEREVEADGSVTRKLIGVKVEKTSSEYPQATLEYLSNNYGYMGRPSH